MKAGLAALLLLAALDAVAVTIEEAYQAIPHKRTPFDAKAAKATPEQARQLERLFALTDQGVVLRVQGMQAHYNRDKAGLQRVLAGYDSLVDTLRKESFSPEIRPARDQIVEALVAQRRVLGSRPEGGLQFTRQYLTGTTDVTQASRQLRGAYAVLMKAFPQEARHNQSAFFDHLCALDFL